MHNYLSMELKLIHVSNRDLKILSIAISQMFGFTLCHMIVETEL